MMQAVGFEPTPLSRPECFTETVKEDRYQRLYLISSPPSSSFPLHHSSFILIHQHSSSAVTTYKYTATLLPLFSLLLASHEFIYTRQLTMDTGASRDPSKPLLSVTSQVFE
ncbi:hypothetical protein VN97_g10344 [Penicillium thymicola]|uniref:Uncharacterized protein n=1 Tax=Penicillium thymicola TaxID=293382 RepID=A0AAI9X478_PENTH|nr:hypothetical protein VN97_g10344 [Penicillium thymicola]